MLTVLGVGEDIPTVLLPRFQGEGANFAISADKEMFLCVSLSGVTAKEKREITKDIVRFRFYERDDVIYPIVCFGVNFSMELPYNPVNTQFDNYDGLKNNLTIILGDPNTKKICGLRMLGLGPNFLKYITDSWNKSINNKEWEKQFEELNMDILKMSSSVVFNSAPIKLDWDQ